jgi:glycosyltransferase involved in cell wall biosynthesis
MNKQPFRILELCASLTAGGAEKLIHGLVEKIDRQRFEIYICGLSVIEGNAFQKDFERLGVPVFVAGAHKMYDPKLYRTLRRYVVEHRIDLIHTHLTSADFVGRIIGRSLGLPVISTFQNVPQDYERETFYRYWLERFTALYSATHLIAVSDTIRQLFIERWHIPAHKISMIPNAVAMERFLSVAPGVASKEAQQAPLITNIARLTEQKAQHILLEAARITLAKRPDARFMLIGQGKLEQQLKAQAAELGIAHKVDFAGVRHDIPEQLAQSTIFTLSSAWEGLPLSAIEAMAAARPVVLTDVGGVRDIVKTGINGILVPPGDPEALAAAYLELLNNEQRCLAMGEAARAQVRDTYSVKTIATQHEALYETILADHRKKHIRVQQHTT